MAISMMMKTPIIILTSLFLINMEEVRFEDLPRIVSTLAMRIEELCGKINKVLPQVEIASEKWFSVDELREYLPQHPSRQTVYGWTSNATIPFHKSGKLLRFKKSEIDKWLNEGYCSDICEIEKEAEEFINNRRKPLF